MYYVPWRFTIILLLEIRKQTCPWYEITSASNSILACSRNHNIFIHLQPCFWFPRAPRWSSGSVCTPGGAVWCGHIQTPWEWGSVFWTFLSSSQAPVHGLLWAVGSSDWPWPSGEIGEHQGCGYTTGSSAGCLAITCACESPSLWILFVSPHWAFQVTLMVKNPPSHAGDARGSSSIPKSRRSLGEGSGNPLQYSCLENSTCRAGWLAIVHDWATEHTHMEDTLEKQSLWFVLVSV